METVWGWAGGWLGPGDLAVVRLCHQLTVLLLLWASAFLLYGEGWANGTSGVHSTCSQSVEEG